jgi:hypothetical protein
VVPKFSGPGKARDPLLGGAARTRKSVRLFELAYTCPLYAAFTDFDKALKEFHRVTSPTFDLRIEAHRYALLVWLNSWGRRQFERGNHAMAAEELRNWAEEHVGRLPSPDQSLAQITDAELGWAAEDYSDLKRRPASVRDAGSRSSPVTFGPTGAAKVLYAVRPNVFPPWDDPIRKHLGYDGSPEAYRRFLDSVRQQVRQLEQEAVALGIAASEIPHLVGRPHSSLPKLVDEFYWVTITKRCLPPGQAELERWVRWASRDRG